MDDWNISDTMYRIERERKEPYSGCLLTIIVFFALLLGGCKSVKYIEVPIEHTNIITHHDTLLKVDSILTRDSVWMVLKGDTVIKEKYKYVDRLKYVYKTQYDTIYQRIDSTIVKVEYVEKPIGFFKKVKMALWGVVMAMAAIAAIGIGRRFLK